MRKYFFALGLVAGTLVLGRFAFGATERVSSSRAEDASASGQTFTLDEAVQTALKRNPNILTAQQEIRRVKGVLIEVVSQVLPHIAASAAFQGTDPHLRGGSSIGSPDGTGTGGGGGSIGGAPGPQNSYFLRIEATQLVYSGSAFPAIRGADFSLDSTFFAFRNVLDQVVTIVIQQFYQVILNKALIGVQQESVRLLESQLKDQQNRFEAGTVPRFNVLQAEVALANQQPALITAINNYRISQLTLAKTLGLDYDASRSAESAPLECVGELVYQPREINLNDAVRIGKERRPFLKQQFANVRNQEQQVGVAWGGMLPTINANSAYEWDSSPGHDNIRKVDKGWFYGATGTWNIFDGLATAGRVKQQRALLSESKITYDDAVRQVELEIQQAFANLIRDRETIVSQEKTVQQAEEAVRLAQARLGAGAGTQLDVLNAQVALTQAASTRLQALFSYKADLAEFDRATATETVYSGSFDSIITRGGPKRTSTTVKTTTTTTIKPSPTPRVMAKKKTMTMEPTPTPFSSPIATPTPILPPASIPSPTPEPTSTPIFTPTPTFTPISTPTSTPFPTSTPTSTPTPSSTSTPFPTSTPATTPTPTPDVP